MGRNKGLRPFEVDYRRRQGREKRWAIVAAIAAALVLGISAADALIWPDALGSQEWSEPDSATADSLEPPPTAPVAALAVTPPLPAPTLQDAATPRPALFSPPVDHPSPSADTRSVNPGISAAPAKAPVIDTSDPHGYVVQVAAMPQLAEAQAVLEQLIKAGHPAYMTTMVLDGVELHRVRVGPFAQRRIAEETAGHLEKEGHNTPWVTK